MELAHVLTRIAETFDRTVEDLVAFCRQPSISAQRLGIQEMADMVVARFGDLRATVTQHPYDHGSPVVFARLPGRTPHTLLFYNHYDVQPPEPLEKWTTSPFEPVIRDGVIYARGAADNKSDLVGRLAVLRAFLDVYGELPVAVTYVVEGEEEIGSPHLRAFIDAHRGELAGDGLIWEGSSADEAGTPVLRLGNKGTLHVELRATGANADSHARYGGIFPNPIWKLVWALSLVRGPDGHVLVPGFYKAVQPPTPTEEAFYGALAANAAPLLARYGLKASFPPRSERDAIIELYTRPTCNLAGISGGYQGSGSKTIVPAEAFAKLEFKLVPDQDPDAILAALRDHLSRNGFGDIEITALSRGFPSKTPLDHPFATLVAETGKRVFGRPMTLEPTSSGTGPRYVFTRWSSIPIVAIGSGNAGSMIHGPNENIRLEHLRGHMKHIATLMHAMAFGL